MSDPVASCRAPSASPSLSMPRAAAESRPNAGADIRGGSELTDAGVEQTATDLLEVGSGVIWEDEDARLDRTAEVMQGLSPDSQARVVAELITQEPGALHNWLQGDRLNALVASGSTTEVERAAVVTGVAEAYNRGSISFSEMQTFLGAVTDRAPALAAERFNGARTLMAGSSPELNSARERFVQDAFAQTAERSARGFGTIDQTSAFAVQLAVDGQACGAPADMLARQFMDLAPAARVAVAQDIGEASIGYGNSQGEVASLVDPLAALTDAVRGAVPTSTEAGLQALTHIAEGLMAAGSNADVLQPQASALYREVAVARAEALADPQARAESLARVVQAQDAAASLLATQPANATPEQAWDFLRSNQSALSAPIFAQYLELRGDAALSLGGAALRNDIGLAMGLTPNRAPMNASEEAAFAGGSFDYFGGEEAKAVAAVEAQISAAGGPGASVAALPVTLATPETGLMQVSLWRVEGADGLERYVDFNPFTGEARRYSSFEDWRSNNQLPAGQMSFPANGHLSAGADGQAQRVTENTPATPDTAWENWIKPTLDVTAAVGGVVLIGLAIAGTGGTAALVLGGGLSVYGGVTAGVAPLLDRATHGQSVDPRAGADARSAWLNVGASALGLGAAGASLRLANTSARVASGLDDAARLAGLTTAARGLNVAAQYADTAAMLDTGYNLAANWDQLTAQQQVGALAQMAFWSGGMALSVRQAGGLGNLYGVGDMKAALGNANQWLRGQVAPDVEIQRVLPAGSEGYVPQAGEQVVEVTTPQGTPLLLVVAEATEASRLAARTQSVDGSGSGPVSRVRPGRDEVSIDALLQRQSDVLRPGLAKADNEGLKAAKAGDTSNQLMQDALDTAAATTFMRSDRRFADSEREALAENYLLTVDSAMQSHIATKHLEPGSIEQASRLDGVEGLHSPAGPNGWFAPGPASLAGDAVPVSSVFRSAVPLAENLAPAYSEARRLAALSVTGQPVHVTVQLQQPILVRDALVTSPPGVRPPVVSFVDREVKEITFTFNQSQSGHLRPATVVPDVPAYATSDPARYGVIAGR